MLMSFLNTLSGDSLLYVETWSPERRFREENNVLKTCREGFSLFSFGANLTLSSGFVINGINHRDFQCINDWKQYSEHLYRGQKHHTDKSDSVIDWGPHIKKYLTDEFRWGQLRISKTGHLQIQNIQKDTKGQ